MYPPINYTNAKCILTTNNTNDICILQITNHTNDDYILLNTNHTNDECIILNTNRILKQIYPPSN